MFKKLSNQAVEASKRLAVVRGEPEYLKGTGRRNAHLMAIAPNASSADLLNQVSAGIEPISAPMYQKKTNAGPFTVRNPHLDDYFQRKYGYDKFHVDKAWTEVLNNNCSLTGLDHLADADTQAVFAKAAEIDQMWLVELAADRQHYIDQAQSLNLFFSPSSDGSVDTNYLHKVHFAAWEKGVKTLYYLRSDSVGKGESLSRNDKICLGCEG
jgi:ribonucleoside-diphosphate reductase alpha chain